ncbi:MAG TPA: hypothetical protein VGB14_00320 [Acidimicrobiales bacterium]|jgi:hypothetical protein
MARSAFKPAAYRVRESFAVPHEGFPRVYPAGRLISADDPLVATHAHLLQPVDEVMEQATSGPGERRNIPLPPDPAA